MNWLFILLASAWHQVAEMRAYWHFLMTIGVFQPILLLLVMFSRVERADPELATPIVTAVMLMAFWNATVWQAAGIMRRERVQGTLAAGMMGVADPRLVLLGRTSGASLLMLALVAVTTGLMLAIYGIPVSLGNPGWFAVGLLGAVFTGSSLGGLLSCLFLLTRYGAPLSAALIYPIFLLAGLLIPQNLLPAWIRPLGDLISLRWLQQFLTANAEGELDLPALGIASLLIVIYVVAGMLAFQRMAHMARGRGTLELV